MVVVKLTTPWQLDYYNQTPAGKGIFGTYKFEVNTDCIKSDYWIIWGGLAKEEEVSVNPGNIIYITDEAHDQRKFNAAFLQQFSTIASVRKDIEAKQLIPIHEFAPWYLHKSHDFLTALQAPEKTKIISVISSDLTWLPGHKKRFAIVNKLIGHFKDKIDVYGIGFNPIKDKYNALIDYKYSVAIENNVLPGYFTEKISECFLTFTLPLYFGCPDIHEYYPEQSCIRIDIDDYKKTILTIEKVIDEDIYSSRLHDITEARNRYLDSYHMFPAIIKMIEQNLENNDPEKRVKQNIIYPESYFIQKDKLKTFIGELNPGIRDISKIWMKTLLKKFRK